MPPLRNAGSTPPAAPRWVKLSLVAAVALVAAFVALHVGGLVPAMHGPHPP
jgi:hypothetical protein